MTRRIATATALGLMFGVICFLVGTRVIGIEMNQVEMQETIFNRGLIGFFVGATAWKLNPYLKASLIGFVVSVHIALQIFHDMGIFTALAFCIAGSVYAMLTELLTSRVFKAPEPRRADRLFKPDRPAHAA